MPRSTPPYDPALLAYVLDIARRSSDTGPDINDRAQIMQEARGSNAALSQELDKTLIADNIDLREGLENASAYMAKVERILAAFSNAPLHPVTFIQYEDREDCRLALVSYGGATRAVALSEDALLLELSRGDICYLGHELNVLVGRANHPRPGTGDLALVDRVLSDGRIVVRLRGDEEIVVEAVSSLDSSTLNPGDQILWDRAARLALERVDRGETHSQFELSEVPDMPLSAVAGDDATLRNLLDTLTIALINPERASKYQYNGTSTILMYGPPGCGKTLMAQVALAEIGRILNQKVHFCLVQGAAFESKWVGETQERIAACFKSLREAAEHGPAVLFIDEIDAMGRIRGGSSNSLQDKFLTSFLTELDGFRRLKNVAVIAASNRNDLLDSALLSRIQDQIHVRRPSLRGARAILASHLPESVPFSPNGTEALATRNQVIDTGITRLYGPNAGSELATLKFSDGCTRVVMASELVSGRLLSQLASAAKRAALCRDVRSDESGIQISDMEAAVDDVIQQLASTITPRNAHHHLVDLAADEQVISVTPTIRRVTSRRRAVVTV